MEVAGGCLVELGRVGGVGDEGVFESEYGGVTVVGREESEVGEEEFEVEVGGAHGEAAA